MLVLIDNYDSFTWNLAHYFEQEGEPVRVVRNDELTVAQIEAMKPDRLVISPGPCDPDKAGISVAAIRHFAGKVPVLGVCLGHQSIGAAFGGRIVRARQLLHGKTSDIRHDGQMVFTGLDNPLTVARYHSLVIDRDTLPADLIVTATAPDGEIMGVRHRHFQVEGVQFHPESILTQQGRLLVRNFLTGGRSRVTIRDGIRLAARHEHLPGDGAGEVLEDIMSGHATSAQIAAWLVAMRQKGETPEEIAACARTMRRFAKPLVASPGVIDTCGTGGDGAQTFNISTVAAFVAAGAGASVAKHGNRSVSSKCGSADVLAELGANIAAPSERMERALASVGFGFAFAPTHHGAMKYAAEPRREIGIRTLFNMLGPLTNPAGAKRQLIGVYEPRLTRFFAEVLRLLGAERAMVVHGHDGLDEITLTGATSVCELKDGAITEYEIDPRRFDFTLCRPEDLEGGAPPLNRKIALAILGGETGPRRDVVLLNAAAALVVAGVAADLASGIETARRSIDSGSARRVLDTFIEITRG
ncbi:MAG: bifunctional anthranilate synthase component II/anthranilate phosphoribosyltransferase [Deltaproteobacteria bacterium]|nr:bifunctional anthranilate synthase component II/anthranilate phosphoribosyltransferase [Deltaproteobacteria bacterium]